MNKSQLIKLLKEEYPDLSTEMVSGLVDESFNEIVEAIKTGQRVEIRGFGSFSVKERKVQAEFYNNKNYEVNLKEKKVVHFKFGKEFFDKVNNS